MICHYVRTDATLNSSKLLDTDGGPKGIATFSRRMSLTDEGSDASLGCLDRNMGSAQNLP
jgi:hypothetical protein